MDEGIDVGQIVIGAIGGLAIFLLGMKLLTEDLKAIAGRSMRVVLSRLTTNRLAAAFTGAFVTAVIQSSSVTTVLLVGFVSASLMSLQQAIGVILGANVGSTFTAQMIAFNVVAWALPLVSFGVLLQFVMKRATLRHLGGLIAGLGLVFLGMGMMSDASRPLRDYEPFVSAMQEMHRPALAILAGMIFTAVVQSSAATLALIITLASQGFVTLETGIALLMGANIGTCVTALLAAIGKPRAAMQTAVAHVLVNVLGVLIWIWLIGQIAWATRAISPSYPNLEGAARLAAETPREIANAHTLFNVANLLIFLPLTAPLAWVSTRLLPEKAEALEEGVKPKYLEEAALSTPSLGIVCVRREVGRIGDLAVSAHQAMRFEKGHRYDFALVKKLAQDVNALDEAVLVYSRKLAEEPIVEKDAHRLNQCLEIMNYFQCMADSLHQNLSPLLARWAELGLSERPEIVEMFRELQDRTGEALKIAVQAVKTYDKEAADRLIVMKQEISGLTDRMSERLGEALIMHRQDRLEAYRLEMEVIEVYRRMYYFAKRIGKVVAADTESWEDPEEAALEAAA